MRGRETLTQLNQATGAPLEPDSQEMYCQQRMSLALHEVDFGQPDFLRGAIASGDMSKDWSRQAMERVRTQVKADAVVSCPGPRNVS